MIEEQTSGIIVSCERKISIVLLGEDEREAQRQMDILHKYLKDLGMNISVEKSQMFEVVAKKDTWFIKEPRIRLENINIPTVDPDEAFRYLGAKMGPWNGIHCGIIVPEILSIKILRSEELENSLWRHARK